MTGDSDGRGGFPPFDRDTGRPPSSAHGDLSGVPAYGERGDSSAADADAPLGPEASDPNATRKPVLRYMPGTSGAPGGPSVSGGPAGQSAPGAPGRTPGPLYPPHGSPLGSQPATRASGSPLGMDDHTQELPPGYFIRDMATPRRQMRPKRAQRGQGPLVLIVSILIVVAVLGAIVATPLRNLLSTSSVPLIGGCSGGSPCQAATAFLADYGSGDYESMYNHVSAASRARFGADDTRGSYKDGHDYIVNRTKAILAEAQVTSIQTTVGGTKSSSDTRATVNVQVVLTSARVGQITQTLVIPLTKESGQWMVDWTPGLIFAQLDDPADPNYHHLVRLFQEIGARGMILDRDGNALAKDDTVYDVNVDASKIGNETSLDNALAADLNMSADQVKAAYKAGRPVRTISKDYYAKISSALSALQGQGVSVQQRTGRVYPYGPDLMAVTGYVSGVTPDDLKNDTTHYYCDLDDPNTCTASDVAGHAGIEAWAETYLRPQKGGTLAIVERNADGSSSNQPLVTIASRQPTNGADVHTAISLKDQQAAMGMLRTYQHFGGGAFAVDPKTGEVLVMASYAPLPSAQYTECDPNDFSLGFTPAITACNSTPGALLNRALQSAQPIGSMFKITTLSAYLHNGGSPTQQWDCTGSYLVPGQQTPLVDNSPAKPAKATAPGAIGPSCDVTYWEIGVYLNSADPNLMPTIAKQFGYGSPVGVAGVQDGVENPGFVPDPQWLKTTKNADWAPIDAANLAIGQGYFLATPAQVALVAAGIANNGVRMRPRLVTTVTGADGSIAVSFAPKQLGTLPLSSQNLGIVQNAMLGTTSPGGTAYSSFQNFPMPVGGKTGTAETPQPEPMSWFMSYAPVPPQTPAIATGVLVEHSTYGEICAVPMTMQILRAQLNLSGSPEPALVHECQIHIGFQ